MARLLLDVYLEYKHKLEMEFIMKLPCIKILLFSALILGLSNANAALITYDIEFNGGNEVNGIEGRGVIVADTELDAIVRFGMWSTYSFLPEYEIEFLWNGISYLSFNERYYRWDLVYGSGFSVLNTVNGLPLEVKNEFLIPGVSGAPYANRLDQNWTGEFWTMLNYGNFGAKAHYLNLRITKVPEPTSLMLFLLGMFGFVTIRKVKGS